MELNQTSIDTLCASLAYAMGIEPPKCAAEACPELVEYIDKAFSGKKADRIFMYNPDAIGQWIYEKYPHLMKEVTDRTDMQVAFRTVMPSVTPVCFGTIYTGAQPAVHGIRRYEKPVINIDTLFDALLRAGKKPVIVAYGKSSLGMIFLEREMDYFIYSNIDQVNAKAAEIIMEDKYDFVVVYNGNYDSRMHKFGPESVEALGELRANSHTFAMFDEMIARQWKSHNTLVGFAMDHGCHEIDGHDIDGPAGSHGLDMPEDLNVMHFYKTFAAES